MRGPRASIWFSLPSVTHAVSRTVVPLLARLQCVAMTVSLTSFLHHTLARLVLFFFVDVFHPPLGLFRNIGAFRPPAFQDLRAGAEGRGRLGPAVQEAGADVNPPRTDGGHGGQGNNQDRCTFYLICLVTITQQSSGV